ncbi:MAG: cupin domain-containing protein [Acidimicrobiales bacterium]
MPNPLIVSPDQSPLQLNVLGAQIKVLASAGQTGSYEIFRETGPEGSGPPPHAHPWDEAFYVLNGEVLFGVDEQELAGGPGTLVHVPGGTFHWFRMGAGGADMLSVTSKAGASALFIDIDSKVSATEPDFDVLVGIAAERGLTLPLPAH